MAFEAEENMIKFQEMQQQLTEAEEALAVSLLPLDMNCMYTIPDHCHTCVFFTIVKGSSTQ